MKDSYHLVGGESSGIPRAQIELALQVGWDVPPGRVVDARRTCRRLPAPPLDFFLARADYEKHLRGRLPSVYLLVRPQLGRLSAVSGAVPCPQLGAPVTTSAVSAMMWTVLLTDGARRVSSGRRVGSTPNTADEGEPLGRGQIRMRAIAGHPC